MADAAPVRLGEGMTRHDLVRLCELLVRCFRGSDWWERDGLTDDEAEEMEALADEFDEGTLGEF